MEALISVFPRTEAFVAFTDALAAAGLPVEDLDGGARFYACQVHGAAVAFGGLEGNGPDQLLRSVVVPAAVRGEGHGRRVIEALAGQARADGAERLWLLTMSSDGFFANLGWTVADRNGAPKTVRASRQFSSLCPTSAVLMCKHLV